ncbi:diguanylate cyclase [Methylomonas methanica]|uniref:diguanylate cyclase n=1 Tax=Methylomonas methanica TaxID=421 RepID=A0A177MMI0_METMH|nr:diguanylate cyclase [Methylomonas methanica]OAI06792.1 diguanylate cyclase [Methylomonas methanica]
MRRITFLVYAVLWILLISLNLYQQVTDTKQYAQKIATRQAEMFFDHIVLIRKWNALHGGVYVPITETTQPNPYLDVPQRDVETTDGKRLTLINPAYMTRQLAEMSDDSGIAFHVTGFNPIRPENRPDQWESEALLAFQQGQKSVSSIGTINGQSFYRYMAPLHVDQSCLVCHQRQGYREGDIRGGISVSIPSASIDGFVNERLEHLTITHAIVAFVGLIVLLLSYLAQARLSQRLDKAKSRMQLAYLDSLTLLPNRRYYDAFVKREWKRALRHKYPISMIMIDIDFFKLYNDNLGHIEGDHCLRQVAKTLKRFFRRPGDLIARYGGEEFCVVAACDAEQIMVLAEILRKAVENMRLPHPASKVSEFVTISLGVASIVPGDDLSFESLLHAADQALYDAKATGRNRVGKRRI